LKYKIILFWSEEDDAYLAEVPELPGCMAHGDSYESALANALEAMTLWLEVAREFDRVKPDVTGGGDCAVKTIPRAIQYQCVGRNRRKPYCAECGL
jgi:predicted RNase H-like HicB family nuclease